MKMKKCYISIPIEGRGADEVEKEIKKYKEILMARTFFPVSPFDRHMDFNAKHKQHMREDFKFLLDCNAIIMARNWEHSVWCRAEFNVALACGIEVIYTMDAALLW